MAISTRNLRSLPGVDDLRLLLQSLAMLDAILCPDWEGRYYSFNNRWAKDEQMGSMRDGCGDDFFALFNEAGCFLKGFAHEAEMSPYRLRPRQLWPGMLDTVPREFAACLEEPAFSIEDTTFCIWRRYADKRWRRADLEFSKGEDPDGSRSLLSILDGCPKTYAAWARDYYEQPVRISDVQFVYAHKPLTRTLVRSLNPNIEFEDLKTDIKEIGYPDDINN